MSITNRTNATVTVTRMAGTTKKSLVSVGTFLVFLGPVSDERLADQYGGIGSTFEIFVETQDLKEGDRLNDGSKTYNVVGVQRYNMGSRPYSRLIAKSND